MERCISIRMDHSYIHIQYRTDRGLIQPRQIHHMLPYTIELMSVLGVYHFRFNKRANIKAGWDKDLKESEYMDFKYCITDILSNNPHIIDRRRYKSDIIKYIQICEGSKGIEEKLSRIGLSGLIYGGLNYPATVTHTDGRKCI